MLAGKKYCNIFFHPWLKKTRNFLTVTFAKKTRGIKKRVVLSSSAVLACQLYRNNLLLSEVTNWYLLIFLFCEIPLKIISSWFCRAFDEQTRSVLSHEKYFKLSSSNFWHTTPSNNLSAIITTFKVNAAKIFDLVNVAMSQILRSLLTSL